MVVEHPRNSCRFCPYLNSSTPESRVRAHGVVRHRADDAHAHTRAAAGGDEGPPVDVVKVAAQRLTG